MNTSAIPASNVPANGFPSVVNVLLNIGHGIDHMFLLIFATAVSTIAIEFGFANWTDLMPYSEIGRAHV